ncbi:AaceriAFL030Cp [[Ashbya] aceris (nom. inval.)]|nr:AaceriAFL030Cp [[Ashbya] aceris (nom. inval.)]
MSRINKDIFTLFDKQAKGTISKSQLGDYLRAIGYNPTNALIQEIGSRLPEQLTLEDIASVEQSHAKVLEATTEGRLEDFIKAFQVFDKENTGKVTVGDIRYMLTGLGERLTDDEVDELMKGVEVDSEGGVDYKKFIEDVLRQ